VDYLPLVQGKKGSNTTFNYDMWLSILPFLKKNHHFWIISPERKESKGKQHHICDQLREVVELSLFVKKASSERKERSNTTSVIDYDMWWSNLPLLKTHNLWIIFPERKEREATPHL